MGDIQAVVSVGAGGATKVLVHTIGSCSLFSVTFSTIFDLCLLIFCVTWKKI